MERMLLNMKTERLIEHTSRQTFKWILHNLKYFDIDRKGNISSDKKLKAFVELAYMLNMFYPYTSNQKDVEKISEFIHQCILRHDFLGEIMHDLDGLAGLAVLEEFELNYGSSQYHFELEKIVGHHVDSIVEKPPFREMDIKYSLEKANVTSTLPSYSVLLESTILGKEASFAYISPMETYSITHTLFYLTDMGRRTPPVEFDKQSSMKKLFSLIQFYVQKRDMDILAELIICINFLKCELNEFQTKYIAECINLISSMQKKDGRVPPVIYHPAKDREREFINCYHTTLVTLGVTQSFER
ncbi:hypothetical protein CO218_11260 [Lactiplantibacillus plantarum]|nr:hypothetical protein [Lactiplantibacillus plantarum]AYE59647.1 hypothetical protein CO218_11260 [Lactiplantibacillus plantarum]KZU50942.1 hypothetical protein Nizo2776_1748 [Lactiplantibacillus plantarum]QBJ54713.1 hypothetical protein C3O83_00900 [Lactiplantibacillus plantarum]